MTTSTSVWPRVFWIVILALVVRLGYVLILDSSPVLKGGDTNWYMKNGRDLVTTGRTAGPLPTAPLYPVLVGAVQVVVPGGPSGNREYTLAEMQVLRVLQAGLGAALCGFVMLLAARCFSERAALLAGLVSALSPVLVIEAGILLTESLFLFFVFGGLALYFAVLPAAPVRSLAMVGVIFGLATLTRAIFLLFPLGIAVHLALTAPTRWRRAALALLVAYGLTISTWTVYNLAVWQRFVIGADGILGLTLQGATGKASPEEFDAQLGTDGENRDDMMRQRLQDTLTGDPLGWAQHRVKELAGAYLQPHNTVYFGGESIRDAFTHWLRHDRSPGGLRAVTGIHAFWPKLSLYAFHFAGLLLGAAGLWMFRRRWRDLLPLYGMILYFTALHLVLLALPRYIFPVYPVLWLFGAGAAAAPWDHRRPRIHEPGAATS